MAEGICTQGGFFSFRLGHSNTKNGTRYKVSMLVVARTAVSLKPHTPPGNRPVLPFFCACAGQEPAGPQYSEAVYMSIEENKEPLKNKQYSIKTIYYYSLYV